MHRDRSPLRRPRLRVARMTRASQSAAWYLSVLVLGVHQGVFLYMAAHQCLHALGVRRRRSVR